MLGDLGQALTERLLDRYSDVPAKRESVSAFCQRMKVDLDYHGASVLEKSLIDHIVICWLGLHQVSAILQTLPTERAEFRQNPPMQVWINIVFFVVIPSRNCIFLYSLAARCFVRRDPSMTDAT